ncbi:cell division protein FtsQ/DivIB [Marivita cryptomonadis]|uniref:Cell division protein FtsQ n=2 Tax=Roseobacteraceae TaxID=2854170 RepID=A0A9Q2NWZ8_9RHOB|nr:cell division protein FtsQ/DivIB [Marivita cryptomonadis]MBM2330915.1 cell division protein FtsQ/DivIB [Marivita cryptomonadis]MBM2340501.1 cell division protein FtsQ/DivIB [Marivita cryptomonadis]MBM2345163.1 cell division protein FtsQ/DivIB [Marivita cryptomonadis]MBM2349841.1 cell division protein FtsQ/DivIB [Marivita cryptomonadis]
MERLMLTPLFRLVLRFGLPCLLTFGIASWWLSVDDNRMKIIDTYADLRSQVESRPEFMVNMMVVDGASEIVSDGIRQMLPLDFPISSFDLDLEAMREVVVALDPVKSARLYVRQGNVLQVDVVERIPVVLWRNEQGLQLLDVEGVLVGPAFVRADWPELPLIVGDGADKNVIEALDLVAAAEPLSARLRGLVRMGERRWDVVLDREQRILLPEIEAVQALERVIAMDQAVDMLERDLVAVDLRLPNRPTLRMTDGAVQELIRIRAIEAGEQ